VHLKSSGVSVPKKITPVVSLKLLETQTVQSQSSIVMKLMQPASKKLLESSYIIIGFVVPVGRRGSIFFQHQLIVQNKFKHPSFPTYGTWVISKINKPSSIKGRW